VGRYEVKSDNNSTTRAALNRYASSWKYSVIEFLRRRNYAKPSAPVNDVVYHCSFRAVPLASYKDWFVSYDHILFSQYQRF
jgi:hypothetical protein